MYDINSNILTKTGLSAAQLKQAENNYSPSNAYHEDFWQALVDAENKYGISSLFMLAHANIESAHGKSNYAKNRNNLFGFNAVDSNPDQASYYKSQAASVDYYANFLKKNYLTPGGKYYNGTTPHGVFVKYSSSHDEEARSVAAIMNALAARISGAPTPTPTPTPSNTYPVKSGDNLTNISKKYPGTNPDAWVNANKAKYPKITGNHIEAGWNLIIPSGSAPAPASTTITVPSGRDGYLSVLASKYGTTVKQLIAWNKAKYPSIGTGKNGDYIQAGWSIKVR